jgi:hypothetical protein
LAPAPLAPAPLAPAPMDTGPSHLSPGTPVGPAAPVGTEQFAPLAPAPGAAQ